MACDVAIDLRARGAHNPAMRIGLGQLNAHVGAIHDNTSKILGWIEQAKAARCDLVILPELAVCGYSPLDLFWRHGFIECCTEAIDRIAAAAEGIAVLVGGVAAGASAASVNLENVSSRSDGALFQLYNRAFLIENGSVIATADKQHLPNDDVYCEKRHFTPGEGSTVIAWRGHTLGINLCEDLWIDDGPTDLQASLGADWIINISASPFCVGKPAIRRRLGARRARENGVGLICVNMVGGQDELVFDGNSFVFDARARQIFQAPGFEEGLYIVDLKGAKPAPRDPETDIHDLHAALVVGIRDYVRKNGFEEVLLGLSGGVDSAVVAALAAEALGPEHVFCVYMPSEFSSEESRTDAHRVADRLGVALETIDIQRVHHALRNLLPHPATGLVDENLQPRLRATLLMALANQRRALVLCPGNKSEIAMGYNTLYGDTVGALAPIADLYKTQVYLLADALGDRIPEQVRTRPPSAELRPHQRDSDDLPTYETLDPVLREVIENNASGRQLVQEGFEERVVAEALRRLRASEYKRSQLPPGIKVSPKAFGSGRRVPLTHGYVDDLAA